MEHTKWPNLSAIAEQEAFTLLRPSAGTRRQTAGGVPLATSTAPPDFCDSHFEWTMLYDGANGELERIEPVHEVGSMTLVSMRVMGTNANGRETSRQRRSPSGGGSRQRRSPRLGSAGLTFRVEILTRSVGRAGARQAALGMVSKNQQVGSQCMLTRHIRLQYMHCNGAGGSTCRLSPRRIHGRT